MLKVIMGISVVSLATLVTLLAILGAVVFSTVLNIERSWSGSYSKPAWIPSQPRRAQQQLAAPGPDK